MIIIVDYGMGNLRSVEKAFLKLGFAAKVSQNKDEIERASAIVVPGVGSFPQAMKNLKSLGFDRIIKRQIKNGVSFLGICLGMQILFSKSDEGEGADGLAIFKGYVRKFPEGLKVPHMGWNNVKSAIRNPQSAILKGIPDNSFFYFVHSYYVDVEDKNIIFTTTDYEIEFTSAIVKDNVIACQFHPEKSQNFGLKFLSNFGEIVKCWQRE